MKTILPAIIALLVLTGAAGSAAMIRSTGASGDSRCIRLEMPLLLAFDPIRAGQTRQWLLTAPQPRYRHG